MGFFAKIKQQREVQKRLRPEPLLEKLERALFAELDVFELFPAEKAPFENGSRDEKIRILESHLEDPESRTHIAAWSELRKLGVTVPDSQARTVLGIVIEVGLYGGIDYLAAYADHSARYYNFSGKKVLWENDDAEINVMIDALLQTGRDVVPQIGLWNGERRRGVANDVARISFLTPSGLLFGEGPMEALMKDTLSAPVLRNAIALMTALIAKSEENAKGK